MARCWHLGWVEREQCAEEESYSGSDGLLGRNPDVSQLLEKYLAQEDVGERMPGFPCECVCLFFLNPTP